MEQAINAFSALSVEREKTGSSKPDLEALIAEQYAQMRPPLLSYIYHLVGSFRDAEDIVQIAFLRLFDVLSNDEEILNLRAWLYRVVHNLAIEFVRSESRREVLLSQWFVGYSERTVSRTSTEDELIKRQQIENALQLLNERERQCLVLRSEGFSYQEISDILEISVKSVSVYLVRGLKKFESKK